MVRSRSNIRSYRCSRSSCFSITSWWSCTVRSKKFSSLTPHASLRHRGRLTGPLACGPWGRWRRLVRQAHEIIKTHAEELRQGNEAVNMRRLGRAILQKMNRHVARIEAPGEGGLTHPVPLPQRPDALANNRFWHRLTSCIDYRNKSRASQLFNIKLLTIYKLVYIL